MRIKAKRLKLKKIRSTLSFKADIATPVLKGMLARILIEHGAEVTGLKENEPLSMKVHDLGGLVVKFK